MSCFKRGSSSAALRSRGRCETGMKLKLAEDRAFINEQLRKVYSVASEVCDDETLCLVRRHGINRSCLV